MSDPRTQLPALPDEARFELSRWRALRPTPWLEQRLARALEAAEASPPSLAAPAGPSRTRWRTGSFAAVAVLAVAVSGVAYQRTMEADAPREIRASREVAVQLPAAGAGWAEIPWHLHEHQSGHARVHLDVPVQLAFAGHLPTPRTTVCETDRCVHRFMTDVALTEDGAPVPLRVRIPYPGRYEIRVHHVSHRRNLDEAFVVNATRAP